jgi:hypothetical protein
MTTGIIYLKMPFKKSIIFREKDVPFLFRIVTLEMTCDDLGIEFGQMFDKQNTEYDVFSALVWNAYLAACQKLYKKPRYTPMQGLIWIEYMSAEARQKLLDEVRTLLGNLKKAGEEIDKNEKLKKK